MDLGLFDPGLGPFPSREGFRGWSGSARDSVFVATDDATPGYLAGPLPPGRWHVALGLAKLAPQGCNYRVEIALDDALRSLYTPPAIPPRCLGAAGWYKGDLQSHTHHSDARGSLDDLVQAAIARGLDFLAVTDHNTISHHRAIAARADALLLIPGEEVTTYCGHANVWGVEGWVDFRVRDERDLDALIADVHASSGLFSVNHPKALPNCIGCDWEYSVPAEADGFEAWQGPWALRNWESLARYDTLLRQGRRLTLVGGSDRHQPSWPDTDPVELWVGSPTTWVYVDELSVTGVLQGLKRGRVCISESPTGPTLDVFTGEQAMGMLGDRHGPVEVMALVRGGKGERLRWLGPPGVLRDVAILSDPFEDRWTLEPNAFVRAEVVAADPQAVLDTLASRLERETVLVNRLFHAEKYLVLRLRHGHIDPREAGVGNIVNCGAAMYMAPVGMINAGNPGGAYQEAIEISGAHQSSYGREAAGVLAAAVAEALRPGATPDSIVEVSLRLAKDGTHDAIAAVTNAARTVSTWEDAIPVLRDAVRPYDTVGEQYRDPWLDARKPCRTKAIEELPVALGMLVATGGDYVATVLGGVNYGRDSDSIAQMGGSLAGALGGETVVPQRWLQRVSKASRRDFASIADDLAAVAQEVFAQDAEHWQCRMASFPTVEEAVSP